MDANSPLDPERLKKLLQRMIDIYSPSGKEEEILEFLHRYLKKNGLPVEKQEVDDNRYNLVVAPQGEVRLALVGHLDTVPAYDLDDYGFDQDRDVISGLGAADMKGGCAAMVEAFVALSRSGSPLPPAALALVVGEEEEGDGARALAAECDFPWAVIGEPTGLRPCLANYGYIEVQLTARGRRKHASLADSRHNPIAAMLRLVMSIAAHVEQNRPGLVYNIRDLYSSSAGFTVPEMCEAWLDIHMPPAAPAGEIVAEIEEILAREREDGDPLEKSVRFATIDAGYEIPEKGPIVEAVKTAFKEQGLAWAPGPFPSHSDANRLWEAGVRPVLLGPGELEHAHVPEESTSFEQVCKAAELYHRLIQSL